ncbi:MAG: arsenic efflux protein [Firmicutes bacterium]|nr:arsenic efflux protein [Bacillota bacterium]
MQEVLHAAEHALAATLHILPFLLAAHMLLELIERSAASRKRLSLLLNGKLAPAAGGALGLIPQCGFSVAATKLYAAKHIGLGTLIAVFIATSDEAIPVLLSNTAALDKVLPLIGIKLVYAIVAGYLINALLRMKRLRTLKKSAAQKELAASADSKAEACCVHKAESGGRVHVCCVHGARSVALTGSVEKTKALYRVHDFMRQPLLHTLLIAAFVFGVNFIFGLMFELGMEEAIASFFTRYRYAAPFVAGLIGLIPNCGASVVIAQSYAIGALSLGAAVAGLSAGAGVAYAVLFKENKSLKQNIGIVLGMYLGGCLLGLTLTLFGY